MVQQAGLFGEMKGTYYAILGQVIGEPDNDTHEKHYYDSMVPAAAAVQVGQKVQLCGTADQGGQ